MRAQVLKQWYSRRPKSTETVCPHRETDNKYKMIWLITTGTYIDLEFYNDKAVITYFE